MSRWRHKRRRLPGLHSASGIAAPGYFAVDGCQSITELAGYKNAPISTDDSRTLNRCLDDAIAVAVTEFGREQNQWRSA